MSDGFTNYSPFGTPRPQPEGEAMGEGGDPNALPPGEPNAPYMFSERPWGPSNWGKFENDFINEGAKRYPGIAPGPWMPQQRDANAIYQRSGGFLAQNGSLPVQRLARGMLASRGNFLSNFQKGFAQSAKQHYEQMKYQQEEMVGLLGRELFSYSDAVRAWGPGGAHPDVERMHRELDEIAQRNEDPRLREILANNGYDAAEKFLDKRMNDAAHINRLLTQRGKAESTEGDRTDQRYGKNTEDDTAAPSRPADEPARRETTEGGAPQAPTPGQTAQGQAPNQDDGPQRDQELENILPGQQGAAEAAQPQQTAAGAAPQAQAPGQQVAAAPEAEEPTEASAAPLGPGEGPSPGALPGMFSPQPVGQWGGQTPSAGPGAAPPAGAPAPAQAPPGAPAPSPAPFRTAPVQQPAPPPTESVNPNVDRIAKRLLRGEKLDDATRIDMRREYVRGQVELRQNQLEDRFNRIVATTPGPQVAAEIKRQIDPQLGADIEGYVAGVIPVPRGTALNNPRWARIFAAAHKIDPTMNANTFASRYATQKSFLTGPDGRNVTSIATGKAHLETARQTLDDLWKELESNPEGMTFLDWAARQASDTPFGADIARQYYDRFRSSHNENAVRVAGLLRKYDTEIGMVATEVARAAKGGMPTQREAAEELHKFDFSAGREVVGKAFDGADKLLSDRLGKLETRYNAGVGTDANGNPRISFRSLYEKRPQMVSSTSGSAEDPIPGGSGFVPNAADAPEQPAAPMTGTGFNTPGEAFQHYYGMPVPRGFNPKPDVDYQINGRLYRAQGGFMVPVR